MAKEKTLPIKERMGYIWDYYKLLIITALVLISIILVNHLFFRRQGNESLEIVVINAGGLDIEAVTEEIYKNTGMEVVLEAYDLSIENADLEDAEVLEVLSGKLINEEIDLMIMPETIFQKYADKNAFGSMEKLTEEYNIPRELLLFSEDGRPVGIDISEPSLTQMKLLPEGMVIGVPASSHNTSKASEMLMYLCKIEKIQN